MCYSLYLASPLTLSEVRSMLPLGMSADLLPPAEQRALLGLYPTARTATRLLLGPCSCDFLIAREHPEEAERHLRTRLSAAGLTRTQVIAALEAHRKSGKRRLASPAEWQAALARLVAEHARNAGPTLYLLRFGPRLPDAPTPWSTATVHASEVGPALASWLAEDRPTIVSR